MNQTTDTPEPHAEAPLTGLATLMTRICSGDPLTETANRLMARIQANPRDANALMDLAVVSHLWFKHDIGLATQAQALKIRRLYTLPAQGRPAIRLLALMHHGELAANTPVEFLVQDSDIELRMLYLDPGRGLPTALPEHDVLFVAIGESERSHTLLHAIASQAPSWPHLPLNRPERIAALSREHVSRLLQEAPGVALPHSAQVARATLEAIAGAALPPGVVLEDGAFPLIVRPLDSHAGHGLEKIDGPERLTAYLQDRTENVFCLSRFVDYRSVDGLYRKYRVALVDGRPFAGHMAISEHWMIHYANAGMDASQQKRDEEAAFMEGFDEGFAARHRDALQAIHQRAGLDYLIVDCAETADGKLLVFEIDSAAVVHAMESTTVFPYKRAQAQKIFDAFRALLTKAAAAPSRSHP